MTFNKLYRVTKRIKLHTSPLYEADVVQEGRFIKETSKYYVFDSFRVQKTTLMNVEEIKGKDGGNNES